MFGFKKKKGKEEFQFTPEEQKMFQFTPEEQKIIDKCKEYTGSLGGPPSSLVSTLMKKQIENEKRFKSQKLINKKIEEIKLRKIVREEISSKLKNKDNN